MDIAEFKEIFNRIMESERMDVTAIAKKAKADRSYLSKLINSNESKRVGPRIMTKMQRAFPKYFEENNKNNGHIHHTYEKEYIQLLKEDRALLAGIIDLNLKLVLQTLRTVAVRQEADEEIILESLARLEGKPENELFQDAGRRKGRIEKAADTHGKKSA